MRWQADEDQTGIILIVDDHLENVNLLTRILNARGHISHTAMNGQEALDFVSAVKPDVILLDIHMPEMDGYEVCRQLKTAETTCDIPIIFVSAISDTDGIVQGLRLGAVDYVTKPFQIEEVCARVENQIAVVRQRQEIERLRAQERRNFEMLNQMKDKFLQMITHDLKNPLGVIQGYAHLLEDAVSVSPEHARFYNEALAGIEHSVEKMKALVTDILDLAHIQSGADLELVQTPVAEFLTRTLRNFAFLAQQKDVTLSVTLPPDDVCWYIDPPRMARVVDNLVSNAIKYTPAGGQVEVAVEVAAQHIILHVEDNGLGIPAEDLPRLFDAFFRVYTPTHRDVEGTGLGLSVVKAIVEQHKGEIAVNSELGAGSTFSVVLPYHHEDLSTNDIRPVAVEQPSMRLAV